MAGARQGRRRRRRRRMRATRSSPEGLERTAPARPVSQRRRSEPSTHTSPPGLPAAHGRPASRRVVAADRKGARMDDVPDNEYLRTFEVAAELGGVSPKTVTRWAKAGKLP